MASGDEIEIPELDISIDPEKLNTEFFEVLQVIRPQWQKDDVVFEKSDLDVNKGLLNTMVKCYDSADTTDAIMIRIHNAAVNNFIDRSVEALCIKHLHKTLDCAPKILATFKNGFCYQFIHGEILNCDRLTEEPIWSLIAEELAKINSSKVLDGKTLDGVPQTAKMMSMMLSGLTPGEYEDPEKNKRFNSELPDKEILKKEFDLILNHLMEYKPAVVLCHNDVRAENIIWNPDKGEVKFVDFEGINYNYQAGEVGMFFSRFSGLSNPDHSKYPSEEFQMKWLRVYLRKFYECTGRNPNDVTDKDIRRFYVLVCKFYLLLLLFAGIIGPAVEKTKVFKEESVDFLAFAISNVQEYFKKKEEYLQLEMPTE